MLVKVLKAFPYAPDCRTLVQLAAGTIADIDDSVVAGLEAEGFVGEANAEEIEAAQTGAVVVPAPVEIPEDWATLSWLKLRPIAVALNGGAAVKDKATGVAIVEAELARRAG